jgi:uncharacterized protein (DUF58 family)
MRPKRRSRLTREGLYFVIVMTSVLIRGSMKEINLMLVVAGMMAGALYFDWWSVRMMLRRFTIRRRLPESIAAGETLVVELEAVSPNRCTAVEVEDQFALAGSVRPEDRGRALAMFPQIAAGLKTSATRAEYRVRFGRRGVYEFDTFKAASRYPFRLVSCGMKFSQPQRLTVLPRLGQLTSRWMALRRGADPGLQRARQRRGLTEGDFYGLRDWRPGDSRRWIHWRTSARRGNLMVRQFEQPRNEDLVLLLDLWKPSEPSDAAPSDAADDNVELAISFAATIAADACRRGGSQLAVATLGETVHAVSGSASRTFAQDVLSHLAVVAAGSAADVGELWQRAASAAPSSAQVVWISTRPASEQERERLAAAATQGRLSPAGMLRVDCSSEELFEYFQID